MMLLLRRGRLLDGIKLSLVVLLPLKSLRLQLTVMVELTLVLKGILIRRICMDQAILVLNLHRALRL
jgi:hypothetical protein